MIGDLRRGRLFIPDRPVYGIPQERSLELPLGYAATPEMPRVAVVLHAFHVALMPEFRVYLANIPGRADLFVSTDTAEKRDAVASAFASWNKGLFEVRVVPNRGRDVAPKLVGFADVHDRYAVVLHLHTKSSTHDARLAGWRGYLLETLLGSPDVVRGVFEAFGRAPSLGMLAPQHIDVLRPWIRWGENHAQAAALAERMSFALSPTAPLDFPSGSMFWARTAALRPLLDLRLAFEDFPEEAGQVDGTAAHAIERLYFLACEHAGFDWVKVTAPGQLHERGGIVAVSSPQELDRVLKRHRLRLRALDGGGASHLPRITSPAPKPRRVLHVSWRPALGDAAPVSEERRLVIVLHGAATPALWRSAKLAAGRLPDGMVGEVLALPDASLAEAQREGFTAGADLVLLIGTPGLLHPGSGTALLRMSEALGGRAILEPAGLTANSGRPVDERDFCLPGAAGHALAVPRAVHAALGLPDHRMGSGAAMEDYIRRARAAGFTLRLCPRARFSVAPGLPEDRSVA